MSFSRTCILKFVARISVILAFFAPSLSYADTVDLRMLLDPHALTEHVMGDPKAPVTIVEYASLTCSHCAPYHGEVFPIIKEKYIDTGKVRYIFREFPLDAVSAAAFMLVRCSPEENFFDMTSSMFSQQRSWAFTDDPYSSLIKLAKQFGFNKGTFDACISNQKILDDITAIRERGHKEFGVSGTPTFFIEGERHVGAMSAEEMSTMIDSKL